MKHLLNCKNCEWHTVVDSPSMEADAIRESHEESIRNWRERELGEEFCPRASVAWVVIE